ncbi:MAG: response regulator transcription factor [Chitinophagaceae bacterium]|nr:response regulator transcription factor [Chitinophagaceae bacterium]
MNVLIIEDERPGAERLASMLQSIDPAINICGFVESVEDGVQWFSQNQLPALVFMDIELSDGNCFQLLKRINPACGIIFTTSYNEFALEAFNYNSIAYLTKPIRKDELRKSIEKFNGFKELFEHKPAVYQQLLPSLYKRDRFLVKRGQKYLSVLMEEVAYFYSEGKIVFLVSWHGVKYVLDYTLDDLEGMVDPRQFYRASRAFIIHLKSVISFENDVNSRLRVAVQPSIDREILVSREKASDFKEWMGR